MIEAHYLPAPHTPVQILHTIPEIGAAHAQVCRMDEPHCKLWINTQSASLEELDWLQQTLHLHPLVLEDIKYQNQRSKLEEYEDYIFTVLHRPIVKDGEIEWEELHMIIGQRWLVTSIDDEATHLATVIKNIAGATNLFNKGIGYLIYQMSESIVSAFFPIMDDYDEEMDQIEEVVIDKPHQQLLNRMFKLKRNLVEMRRYLAPQRDVFRLMLDHEDDFFDEHIRVYFRDVYDHQVRVYDMLDTLRDQVGNATDLYLSVVNNNMNQVMKRLTVITTIFLPITFITGVLGMNFGHSPQVENDPGWFFWAALVFMAFVAYMIFFLLKRNKLI